MMSKASTTNDEIAIERVVGFLTEFDQTHLDLAYHAAFPLVLTPDLLYKIWLRFVPQAPWIAVARVLLSRLCQEVGYELYEMDIAVRNLLLTELKEDERFGQKQLEKLADFLTNYVTQKFAGENIHTKKLAEAQYWTALAYTKPAQLSRELLEAIQSKLQEKNWEELFRISSLIESFTEPLKEFAPLLITYSRGIERLTCGDKISAEELFKRLPTPKQYIEINGVNVPLLELFYISPFRQGNSSLTVYAFHLRNSINQGLETTLPAAPQLWEQLVDLGNAIHIQKLQTIRQELICYEGDRYFPEAEDIWGNEYFNLLQNQEPSLRFQVSAQTDGLEIQGLLSPFRLHDTYAIDLTLYSQSIFTLPQLTYLNPQNLILQKIQASLGQTLWLFAQPPLETGEDNYQDLADACVTHLFPGKHSIELVETGRLLGNPIFEYESGLTNSHNKIHILVWFKCQDMNPKHMDRVAEIFLYLLWFRHKILYVYRQSRWCVKQVKELYVNLENYRSEFSQISQAPNWRSHLNNLHYNLKNVELDYTNYLDALKEHQQAISINESNYKNKLDKIEQLPDSNLIFCQDFLQFIHNKLQRQIQEDIKYLERRGNTLQHLIATVQDTLTTEAVKPGFSNNNITGISSEIYIRLYEALLDCDQFDDARRLKNFFRAQAPLRPWRDQWQASSPRELVEDAIGFLNDKFRDDTKENALVILVELLAKQIDPADTRYRILTKLAQELKIILSSATPLTLTTKGLPTVHFGQEANLQDKSMSFLHEDEKLLTCARSVARVSVPRIIDGRMEKVPTGTGWLVTPELALTCWHVIEARGRWDYEISELDLREQIANSLLIFDNALPGQGVEYKIKKLEHYNLDLDYALLRLQDREARPLQQWGFLKLGEDEPIAVQTKLLVIQHPKGQPLQRSEGYYIKDASDGNRLLHNAPTDKGTSGAPVLKVNNWEVVALHNGENEAEQLREATLISSILSDLRQYEKELHNEIIAVQNL